MPKVDILNMEGSVVDSLELNDAVFALAGGKGSALGTGGMVTKLKAAAIATRAGCEMLIANGKDPHILYDIAAGKNVGTRFLVKGAGK